MEASSEVDPPYGESTGAVGADGERPTTMRRSHGTVDEFDSLLRLLHVCPVGLIDFAPDGAVHHVNPAAVELLAPLGGLARVNNVFEVFGSVWPELPAVAGGDGSAARPVTGHRLRGTAEGVPWSLSLDLLPAGPGRWMLTVTDATAHDVLDDSLSGDDTASGSDARFRSVCGSLVAGRHETAKHQALLAAALTSAPFGVAVFDVHDRCLELNDAMGRLLDVEPSAAVGRLSADLFAAAPPGTMTVVDAARDAPLSVLVGEHVDAGSRGPRRVWAVSGHPVGSGGSDGVVAVVMADASDREERARRVAQRKAELSALFSSIDEGFCICEMITDAAGTPVDYRFVDVNPVFETMTGLVDARGRSALELVPDLEPSWIERYARVGLGRETIRFEQGSDAMGRWFDVFAMPLEPPGRFAVVFKDESARRRQENELRQNEQTFRRLADELPLIVWVHDRLGRQEWVNQTFCEFFGVGRDRMTGDRWHALMTPERSSYVEAFEKAVADETAFHAVTLARRHDGAWRWLESWARPRFDGTGSFIGHLGSSADITDRVEAEREVRLLAHRQSLRIEINSALEGAHTVGDAVDCAAEVLGRRLAVGVSFVEIDERDRVVPMAPAAGTGHDHPRHDFGTSMARSVRAGRVLVVDDVATDARLGPDDRGVAQRFGSVSFMIVPLRRTGVVVAALALHRATTRRRWTSGDVEVATESLERVFLAVERIRWDDARRLRGERAEAASQLLAGLARLGTVGEQLQALVDGLVGHFADYALVRGPDEGHPVLAFAGLGAATFPRPRHLRTLGGAAAAQAQLTVPLSLGDGRDAVLLVGLVDGTARQRFREEEHRHLQELAVRVGAVLASTWRRQEEHHVAVTLQRSLLPDGIRWHPNVVMDARYRASSDLLTVGGDWYDTFQWAQGPVGFMVGDIAGHNLESAVAMGRMRAAVSALAHHVGPHPAALLDAIDLFARGPDGTEFATAVCAVVNPDTGELTYASAGHPPIVVVHPDGTARRLEDVQSPPICALPRSARRQASIILPPGALVVAYTDGLVERRTEVIDVGLDRLTEALIAHRHDALDALASTIVDEEHRMLTDDVVLLCFRYTPLLAHRSWRMPPASRHLAELRRAMGDWLAHRGLTDPTVADLQLIVGEALTNAIDHAYEHRVPADVDVTIQDHGAHLIARVRDGGVWKPPGPHTLGRGRGLEIMRAVASHVHCSSTSAGTELVFTLPVPARRAETEEPGTN